jgi:hypothetical protein
VGDKILRTIFFMLKHCHHRDSATDYEALFVQRNALRWIKVITKFGFLSLATPDRRYQPQNDLHGSGSRLFRPSSLSR